MSPRILIIDLETSPHIATLWGLWKQNVSLNQLLESTEVICFAAKWYGDEEVMFYSAYDFQKQKLSPGKRKAMVKAAWSLIHAADIVVGYNHGPFDMPHLNREFLRAGLTPPSPVKLVDLLSVSRKVFNFASNKLQYVSQYVGLEGKIETGGHELWLGCMNGDPGSWERMREYNKWDVELTEQLYDVLLPWIPGHPHVGLYADEQHVCQNCGSGQLKKEGFAYTKLGKYQQYSCKKCGHWSRGKKALEMAEERSSQ